MDKDKCLHCGDGIPNYCEKCYQKLVAENLELQIENEELLKELKYLKEENKHLITNLNDYDF